MKKRILQLLKIKHTESRHVTDLLTVQFWIGISNAFINIVAFSLFVKTLSIQEIPQAYLVIAASLLVLNLIYEKLEHRFSPLQLVKIILAAYAVVLVLLWADLSFWDKHSAIFILLVVSFLMYMLTGYAFWGLVSLLYNIRESKRVFSVVGSGDIPAKLIGYLAAPLIAKIIGYPNLIWLSVVFLLVGLFQFNKVIQKKRWDHIRHKEHNHHHHEVLTIRRKDYLSFFFKNELIFAISLISLVSYNVFNLIDFTFLAEVKNKYDSHASLATFIAVFFALGRLIALVAKLVFTSRVIDKLGIVQCLFITPLTLLVFCLVFLATGSNSTYAVYIFGLMALLTEVLRSTIQEPVFFILFQPLKEQLRLKGHLISKGYMLPPSLIIVGLSLILLNRSSIKIDINLTVKILLLNLVFWSACIFFLRNAYLRTLRQSIKKGYFSSEHMKVTDQETIDILVDKIRTGKETDVLYALHLLETADYPHFQSLLQDQLLSPHRAVRQYVLEKLEEKEMVHSQKLRELLPIEKDPQIKQQLVSMLCKNDPEYLQEISGSLHDLEPGIRKAVITNMLNQREFKHLYQAGEAVDHLIHSPEVTDRELAIEIASELKNVRFTDAMEELVHDPVLTVKRQAIIAACKLKTRKLLPHLVEMLARPADKYLALQGLQFYGDEFFSHLKDVAAEEIENIHPDLIKIAGKCRGHNSTNYLLARMMDGKGQTEQVVHALWFKGYEPGSSKEVEELNTLLSQFLEIARQKVNDYHEVPAFEDKPLLQESIDHEIRNDLNASLKICSILYNKTEFNRILELMDNADHKRLVNAIEMLELVLPKRIAKDMNVIFDYLLDPTLHKETNAVLSLDEFMDKIVNKQESAFSPWTKAVCIYSSWKNHQSGFLHTLRRKRAQKEHYIVQETQDFVLQATDS